MNEDNIVQEVKVLPVGEGQVRIGIHMGYSREVPNTGIYVKPSIYLEVPKPLDYELDEYVSMIIEHLSPKLKEIERQLMRLAGFSVKGDH